MSLELSKAERVKTGKIFENELIERSKIELTYFKMSPNSNERDRIYGDILIRNQNDILIAAVDAKFSKYISLNSVAWFFGIRNARKHRAIYMLENGIMNNSDDFREFIRLKAVSSFKELDLKDCNIETAATKIDEYAKNRHNIDLGYFMRMPSNDMGICFDDLPDHFKLSTDNWKTVKYWYALKDFLKY